MELPENVIKALKDDAARGCLEFEGLCRPGICGECDVRRSSFADLATFFSNVPLTKFQAQLLKMGACWEGRARVGAQTARAWWSTSTTSSDMRWMLDKLHYQGILPDTFYPGYNDYKSANPDAAACERIRTAVPFEQLQELSKKVGR